MKPTIFEKPIGIKEAAKMMCVCEATLRDWDNSGVFTALKTAGNHRRYRPSDIKAFQENGIVKTTKSAELPLFSGNPKFAKIEKAYLEFLHDSDVPATVLNLLTEIIKLLA